MPFAIKWMGTNVTFPFLNFIVFCLEILSSRSEYLKSCLSVELYPLRLRWSPCQFIQEEDIFLLFCTVEILFAREQVRLSIHTFEVERESTSRLVL